MSVANILKIIVDHTKEVVPSLEEHHFIAEDSLCELGANSIDRSEIIMMALESLSLSIPLIKLAKAENIGELAEIIHENQ